MIDYLIYLLSVLWADIRKHEKYLSYVVRHKWYVLKAGLSLKVPLHQLVIHDWSKFLPSEWRPYAENFYGLPRLSIADLPHGDAREAFLNGYKTKEDVSAEFDRAWLKHQNRQPHHWQYWVLLNDSGTIQPLPMPRRFMLEMIADWCGAGRAIHKPIFPWESTYKWFNKNRDKMNMHPDTVRAVHDILTEKARAEDSLARWRARICM